MRSATAWCSSATWRNAAAVDRHRLADADDTALLRPEGLKVAVGRARPTAGLGSEDFEGLRFPSTAGNGDSFPSRHITPIWAAITPYALEYDRLLLYGVAALTNVARVGS
jgi:hypothetical protein